MHFPPALNMWGARDRSGRILCITDLYRDELGFTACHFVPCVVLVVAPVFSL